MSEIIRQTPMGGSIVIHLIMGYKKKKTTPQGIYNKYIIFVMYNS